MPLSPVAFMETEQLLSIAHSKYTSRDFGTALSILQTLFYVNSTHIPTLLLLGCACYSLSLYALSVYYNQLILSIDPNFAEAYSNMGTTYRALGNDDEAERHYLHALRLTPDYWDGIRNLVGIYCAKGKWKMALEVYEGAEMVVEEKWRKMGRVTWPVERRRDLYYGKGSLRFALGDTDGAREEYYKALHVVGFDVNQAVVEIFKASVTMLPTYQQMSATHPVADPKGKQQFLQAVLYQGTLISFPQHVLHMMGTVMSHLRASAQALGREMSWMTTDPETVSTLLQTLAKLYQDSHALANALPLYYLSLAIYRNPHACNLLGILLTTLSFHNHAIQFYQYGLGIDRSHVHLYTNLGSVLKDQGHIMESIRMYEKAVQLNPDFEIALANLANVMKDVGRVDEACQLYRRALQRNPSFEDAFCNFVNVLCFVCDWKDRDANFERLGQILEKQLSGSTSSAAVPVRHGGSVTKATSLHPRDFDDPDTPNERAESNSGSCALWATSIPMKRDDPQLELRARQIQLAQSCPPPSVPTVLPFHTFTYPLTPRQTRLISYKNASRILYNVLTSSWYPSSGYDIPSTFPVIPAKLPSQRVRVGYVSSDFGNHPLSHLMQSVFGMHSKTQFEVFCYALSPSDGSPYRRKIENEAEHFLDVHNWSLQDICHQINRIDQIHILVNLNGYTKGARNEIFAARVAPVQLAIMGFAGTMGAVGWIDYLVSDEIATPRCMVPVGPVDAEAVEADHNDWIYTEKMIYMPDTYFANDHRQGFRNESIISTAQLEHDFAINSDVVGQPHGERGFVDALRPGSSNKTRVCVMSSSEPNPDRVLGDPIVRTHQVGSGLALASTSPTDELGNAPASGVLPSEEIETDWLFEEIRRWKMRKEVFEGLAEDTVIFANFNQLYKVDPAIFQVWLRILQRVPNSILWLLKFPAAGEQHLKAVALDTMGEDVARRVVFTDIAPKHIHIARGRVVDCFLDTPECNGHTTACDILWSGTPIVTLPRHIYKMCSRVAASVCYGTGYGDAMVVCDEQEYEERAVVYGRSLGLKRVLIPAAMAAKIDPYITGLPPSSFWGERSDNGEPKAIGIMVTENHFEPGIEIFVGQGSLYDLKKNLYMSRDGSRLFDTSRWVRNLERGMLECWRRWMRNELGHDNIYLENEDDIASGKRSTCEVAGKRIAERQLNKGRLAHPPTSGFVMESEAGIKQEGDEDRGEVVYDRKFGSGQVSRESRLPMRLSLPLGSLGSRDLATCNSDHLVASRTPALGRQMPNSLCSLSAGPLFDNHISATQHSTRFPDSLTGQSGEEMHPTRDNVPYPQDFDTCGSPSSLSSSWWYHKYQQHHHNEAGAPTSASLNRRRTTIGGSRMIGEVHAVGREDESGSMGLTHTSSRVPHPLLRFSVNGLVQSAGTATTGTKTTLASPSSFRSPSSNIGHSSYSRRQLPSSC